LADILHFIKVKAEPARVCEALTTPEGIRSWWTRDADLEQRVGGVGGFRFFSPERETRVIIETLEPPSRVGWKVTGSFLPNWIGTRIGFDARADDVGAALSFAHRGFAQADEAYAAVNTGWAYYLVSLQQYLETGAGAPSPDLDFRRMVR